MEISALSLDGIEDGGKVIIYLIEAFMDGISIEIMYLLRRERLELRETIDMKESGYWQEFVGDSACFLF